MIYIIEHDFYCPNIIILILKDGFCDHTASASNFHSNIVGDILELSQKENQVIHLYSIINLTNIFNKYAELGLSLFIF